MESRAKGTGRVNRKFGKNSVVLTEKVPVVLTEKGTGRVNRKGTSRVLAKGTGRVNSEKVPDCSIKTFLQKS